MGFPHVREFFEMNDIYLKEMLYPISLLEDPLLKEQLHHYISFKSDNGLPFAQLVVSHYQIFGGRSELIYRVAAGIELLILSFDIFDDIEDKDQSPAPWNNEKEDLTINVATALFKLSHVTLDNTLSQFNNGDKAKTYFNHLSLSAIDGQHQDLQNLIYNEHDYFNVTMKKSGALVALACTIGAILVADNNTDSISHYGQLLGVTSQIQNDIEDILRLDKKNDLLYKKKTLPILFLLGDKREEFACIQEYYQGLCNFEYMETILPQLVKDIRTSGAIEYANVHLLLKQEQAIKLIQSMTLEHEIKEKLVEQIRPNN